MSRLLFQILQERKSELGAFVIEGGLMSEANVEVALARIVGRTNLLDDLLSIDIFEDYYSEKNDV